MIETKRLRIYTASREEMKRLIESAADPEMKAAYTEMLDGCLNHPGKWEWHAAWIIELKDGIFIGDLCFKGLEPDGAVEIGYGIEEKFQGNGYATEAVAAAVKWAFGKPGVTRVEAETDPGNVASQRVLAKCGFTPNGLTGKEGPRFEICNPG